MVKTLNPAVKKEKSADKRKRRENSIKAREQARRYVMPMVVLLFGLLAAFLFVRFGMGTKLSPEEVAKIRSQRQLSKMMREHGTDFSKLREMIGNKKDSTAFGAASEKKVDETVQVKKDQDANVEDDSEAVVE